MDALKTWLDRQLDERLVEPNSSLGKAIVYMQTHWETLTRFLSVPGAPLDNNLAERALKLFIRQRKNSLFYPSLKTIVHTVWNRIESQSVTQESCDACI
jgi:transposase